MRFTGKMLAILLGLNLVIHPAYAKHRKRHLTPPAPTYTNQSLITTINQIVNSGDPNAAVGIQIKSMKYGDTLYSRNSQQLFTPASILKILTAEAALLYLGPHYTFSTRVATNAKATNNGTLSGDLYLIHSGDPTLTYYDLADLMVTLKSEQIQTIAGNVYIDNTAYDQNNIGPGWTDSDSKYCYAAPINASIINHNCISFKITPAKVPGRLANIIQSPRFYYPGIENAIITKAAHASCAIHMHSTVNNLITLNGCMAKGYYATGASIVVNNIIDFNKSMMHSLFNRFNIQLNGTIYAKAANPGLNTLAVHQSNPLHLLINDMLKNSNNITAGSLFKKIGQSYTNQAGSWQNGSFAITQILGQKVGIHTSGLKIIDGSGLSRNNKVTPAQMMEALDFAFHHYTINYEFISALPIAGVDGTLKHRFKNIAWKVRAKTGTIKGVVSLAGYAVSKNKEPFAFVIMINGHNGNSWKYREMEDKIITALTRYSRDS